MFERVAPVASAIAEMNVMRGFYLVYSLALSFQPAESPIVTTETKLHVYDILAKSFLQEGVKTCFTLMGDANMNWAARLAQQGCRMVYVRHEHCAVAAGMAYARKTGEIGVATVTCGPGVTQLITA